MQHKIKRLFDIIFSSVGMIILAPFFILIGTLIKLESEGPVFFKQERLGKKGEFFKIYKFRTMIKDAEKKGGGIYTGEKDPRITRMGKILRKTSLDELPQLINVLKGEMSIIGPRPPVPYHPKKYDEYSEREKLRFTVLPGVTGYAQVNGRQSLSWDEKIKYDIEYVENHSLWLDLKILFKTVIKVFKTSEVHKNEIKSSDSEEKMDV